MTTIQVTQETLQLLRIRKAQFADKTYDETINHLLARGNSTAQP